MMKPLKYARHVVWVVFAASSFAAGTTGVPSAASTAVSFSVTDKTEIPGKTLKPGTYDIHIVDHLTDRMIVEIDRKGKPEATFLALPSTGLTKGTGTGPLVVSGGTAKSALRGFVFQDGTLAEFVYPKSEAVALAKANKTKIPAVDPASEGRPADPELSSQDMREITLWMLTPTEVGPGASSAGIKAERYQQAAANSATAVTPRPRIRPLMAALPHTAGLTPVILLALLLSTVMALFLARRRRNSEC